MSVNAGAVKKAVVHGFDNEPPAELQEKRQTVGLPPLPPGAKVYRWTDAQVWIKAADGTTEVNHTTLVRSRVRLARFGLPCDTPETAAVAEFQRCSGGYTVAGPLAPLPEAWAVEMAYRTQVTYAVASGRCRFEFSSALRGSASEERLVVRAVAGDGVTALGGVPHRIVPEEEGTAVLPLFNESAAAEDRVPHPIVRMSDSSADARDPALNAFLERHSLAQLAGSLASSTLRGLCALSLADRPSFLRRLQQRHGIGVLGDRQKLANTLARAMREGELPPLSTAMVLEAIGDEDAVLDESGAAVTVVAPEDVRSQQPSSTAQRVPRVLFQTNKTRRVGARAWANVCAFFERHPSYSYRFYDDERCEQLISEHFGEETRSAFASLRVGAAKADLWRYCALAALGGVYLDLDSAIVSSLEGDDGEGGSSQMWKSGEGSALIGPLTDGVFLYDAEANLIQWVLIAAPRHPVLLRCVELTTRRVLEREPNIFVATGPSLFTDAFIEHMQQATTHARAGSGVYASRTAMQWSTRLAFLQHHGALAEPSHALHMKYDGYQVTDIYEGGARERYLPTWGAEPTHGLYHTRTPEALGWGAVSGAVAGAADGEAPPDAGGSAAEDVLAGRYTWSAADTADDGVTWLRWWARLELRSRPWRAPAVPPYSTFPSAVLWLECERRRTAGGGTSDPADAHTPDLVVREAGHLRGSWRHAPGKACQLHLFEWVVMAHVPEWGAAGAEAAAGPPPKLLGHVEAPSVMLADGRELQLEGWQGDQQSVDGLSHRMAVSSGREARWRMEAQTFLRDGAPEPQEAPPAAVEQARWLQMPMKWRPEAAAGSRQF